MSRGLLQERIVLLLIGWAGIVKDDHFDRMAVAPKVLIITLHRLTDSRATGK
jgi:hypothetical protein